MPKNVTQPKKVNRSLPNMSQNTKFVINIIALFFIFSVGYSAYAIYQNRHHHDGSHYSLINLLTGKGSNNSKLKDSESAKQTAKQVKQYNAGSTVTVPTPANIQRQVVAKFLDAYLANKNASTSQDSVVATYGNSNLADQYHSLPAKTDLLYCQDSGKYTSAGVAANVYSGTDGTYYNVVLSSSRDSSLQVQLRVVGQGDSTKVDQVFCPGPV